MISDVGKNSAMTNDREGIGESIRLLDTSGCRGTIKQWERGDRTDIKKETDESGRKGRVGDEFFRAQQHMYPPSFLGQRSTTSKSITSDDNPMLRNA